MSAGGDGPLVVLTGRGHGAVRASHAKTIEFTPDDSLGPGGTCIVAVSSIVSGGAAAGAVELELAAGSLRCVFAAVANPDWDATGPAVIRRSDVRRADTLATHSTWGAVDLPADLRATLADPNAEVTLTVTRRRETGRHVVLVSGELSGVERASADLVVGADCVAEAPLPAHGRILVLGDSIPGQLLAAAVQPLEVLGLTPERAVAAASPTEQVLAGDVSAIADGALRESALVMCVSAKELPRVIRAAQRHGRHSGAVLGRLPWVYWGRLADAVAPAGSRTVWVCLDPAARAASDDVLLARITELRANGLTTKALARQVAAEFGVPVNRVYALSVAATTAHALRSGES